MRIKKFVAIFTSITLFYMVLSSQVFAKESNVIWQEKLVNKSFVWSGATTSKNETMLATYTTKKNIDHYEIFKVNNVTSKVKHLSTLDGGKVYLFDFKEKGYILHLEKKNLTIYDENFKSIYSKSWKSNIKFHDFSIRKSDVDDNIFVFGGNIYNFDSKKNEDFFVFMNHDKKGKLLETTSNKAPGEAYILRYTPDNFTPIISQQTISNDHTNFELKVDRSTIPNVNDGYRISFSSNTITKYKDHFYFFLRKNEMGSGNERLLKVNTKGKVVDFLELEDINISDTNEPQFIGNQVIYKSLLGEQNFYHLLNLDTLTEKTITGDPFDSPFDVINENLFYITKDGESQFYNVQNTLLYTLPSDGSYESIYDLGNKGNYGVNRAGNTITIFDLKTGEVIINTNMHPLLFNDNVVLFEEKSGYTEVKLINLASYKTTK
ncbi:hypothetical protein [Solibacillus sp. CAU 1738]|uniref:hypothetical protein n=1 Tax=Solibacillus sp. CAU 1738 TaxID=3140363 RepID=UPI0032609A96